MKYPFYIAMLFTLACENNPVIQANVKGQEVTNDVLIKENQSALKLELVDIKNYLRRHQLETIETGRGVHLSFFEDVKGPLVKSGQEVLIEHEVSLLNGKKCYASEPGMPESFFVDNDNVESGLHDAIQFLSPGDSVLIVIPSHLAHGLAGDLKAIPMRSTIVYNLRLLAVR